MQAEFLLKTRAQGSNPWINRMIDTRTIVMLPMSNPLGYDQEVREENMVDPNRDFPYVPALLAEPCIAMLCPHCLVFCLCFTEDTIKVGVFAPPPPPPPPSCLLVLGLALLVRACGGWLPLDAGLCQVTTLIAWSPPRRVPSMKFGKSTCFNWR